MSHIDESLLFMNTKPLPTCPRVFVIGMSVGLMAGWSCGCSNSSSANVDVKKAREAFAKRRADFGESPRSESHERAKAQERN